MSIATYAYISARIGAMRSYLLDENEIKSLMETTSAGDAISVLKDTSYGRELEKIQSPDLREVEEVLSRSLLMDYEKVLTSVGGATRKFIEKIGKRFEINGIKTLALMKVLGVPREKAGEHSLTPFGRITKLRLAKMLETETVEEFVESMRDTEYYEPLQKGLLKFKQDRTPFAFIAALDDYVYSNIMSSVKNLTGRDKKLAKALIGPEIDAKNLMLVIRCRELDEDRIWELLLKDRYKLNDGILRACVSENLEVLVSEQFPYKEYTSPGMKAYKEKGSILGFETGMKRHILDLNKSMFYGDRFHIGTLIGYLNLKENEVRNLVAILKGRDEKLSTEDIRKLIILPTPTS
jgi:V/A-type H+-transporting ATPase subunit C